MSTETTGAGTRYDAGMATGVRGARDRLRNGFNVLVWAARAGMADHSVMFTLRTWLLGWFLILGSLLAEVFRQIMIGATLSGVSTDERWYSTLGNPDFPLTAVIVGFGLITISRILARAVLLQREQDATI